MKRVLVTAGGTVTAWYITNEVKKYFCNTLEIHICDRIFPYLVLASSIAKMTHKVLGVAESDYTETIGKIVEREKTDCIIPLIQQEAYYYASDSVLGKKYNRESEAPTMEAKICLDT